MTVLSRFFEQRSSLENPQTALTAGNLSFLTGGVPNHAGVTVTEDTAMRLIAVYRCVELIAGTCAALPLKAYEQETRRRVNSSVLSDPHPDLTDFEVWEIAYSSLLLWGNAYFRKYSDGTGAIRRLHPINPARVRVELVNPPVDYPDDAFNAGNKRFFVTDVNGRERSYTRNEILHIPGLGYDGRVGMSRIRMAASGISTALAAEEYAGRFFGNGSLMSGILETDQRLEEDGAKTLKRRWQERVGGLRGAHEVAVLDSGAKFRPISIPPNDAQLLESRSFSTTEIARLFGLPPHAIGDVEKSTSWGSGIEQQTIGMVQFTLQPSYLTRVEKRVTKEVLLNPRYFAEYTVEGLLRGDSSSRAQFYTAMTQIRAMNPNEVRKRENLEPYEGGDEFANPNITPGPSNGSVPDGGK